MNLELLLKYWQGIGLVAAVLVAMGFCRARDDANRRAGAAEALTAVVRDSLHSNAQQIRVSDTVTKHDTIIQRRWIARTDTLRDSVLLHLTDTVRVKEFVRAVDSTIHACTEVTNDCAKFRVLAEQRFNGYEQEIKALQSIKPRGNFGLGLSAGIAGVYDLKSKQPTFGPGVSLGFTFRW